MSSEIESLRSMIDRLQQKVFDYEEVLAKRIGSLWRDAYGGSRSYKDVLKEQLAVQGSIWSEAHNDIKKQLDNAKSQVGQLASHIKALDTKLNSKSQELGRLNHKVLEQKNTINRHEARIGGLEAEGCRKDATIASLRKSPSNKTQRLSQHQSERHASRDQSDALEKATKEVDSLKTQSQQKDAQIKKLQNKFTSENSVARKQQSTIDNLKKSIKALNDKNDRLKNDAKEVPEDINFKAGEEAAPNHSEDLDGLQRIVDQYIEGRKREQEEAGKQQTDKRANAYLIEYLDLKTAEAASLRQKVTELELSVHKQNQYAEQEGFIDAEDQVLMLSSLQCLHVWELKSQLGRLRDVGLIAHVDQNGERLLVKVTEAQPAQRREERSYTSPTTSHLPNDQMPLIDLLTPENQDTGTAVSVVAKSVSDTESENVYHESSPGDGAGACMQCFPERCMPIAGDVP